MLFDSNLIIYAAKPEYGPLRNWIAINSPVVSVVSFIEVLGYHQLTEADKVLFEEFFATTEILTINDAIAEEAVRLRQQKKVGLGDALIAATALTHNLSLATHNTKNFGGITGLSCYDPLTE